MKLESFETSLSESKLTNLGDERSQVEKAIRG